MEMRLIVGLGLGVALLSSCGNGEGSSQSTESVASTEIQLSEIRGEAQGTTYSIKYADSYNQAQLKFEVDSILIDVDNSLSTWVSTSLVSELNNSSDAEITFDDHFNYFTDVFKHSREVYKATDGAFNPTVGPLSNAWGFGFKNKESMNQAKVDSLLPLVGFEYEDMRLSRTMEATAQSPERVLVKGNPAMELDFNAIAQGYSVDVLGRYLERLDIKSYMIELGGEVLVGDAKPNGDKWRIGVDEPKANLEERELNAVLAISNVAVATSGNYRKFYEIDGVKYAHTLDPMTGFPVKHGMLSATVLAESCWRADAMATAFMVMGPEKAMAFMQNEGSMNLAAYFIYNDESGTMKTFRSEGVNEFLEPVAN